MRKPMEFPTEWTLPDPVEDRGISLDEQVPAAAAKSQSTSAEMAATTEPPLTAGAASGG